MTKLIKTENRGSTFMENKSDSSYSKIYPEEIEISINKITFDGFDNFNTTRLNEIISENLLSILSTDDFYISQIGNKDNMNSIHISSSNLRISNIDAGTFSLSSKTDVTKLGNETAKSIASSLTKGNDEYLLD